MSTRRAVSKREPSKSARSIVAPPEPPLRYAADASELCEQRLKQALQAGYNAAEDILAFAKVEELQAFDRLARWQVQHGVALTVEPIAPAADREHLAAQGAIAERWHYFETSRAAKLSGVRWIHEGFELDSDSEAELMRQVYDRIKARLRVPARKAD